MYTYLLSLSLLLNSFASIFLSLTGPANMPRFSLALRERYGKTSSTGPYGIHLYAKYPAEPVNRKCMYESTNQIESTCTHLQEVYKCVRSINLPGRYKCVRINLPA